MFTLIDLIILGLLVVFFIAFSFGFTQGRKKGLEEGEIINLLKLREEILLLGHCSLCGYKQDSDPDIANQTLN